MGGKHAHRAEITDTCAGSQCVRMTDDAYVPPRSELISHGTGLRKGFSGPVPPVPQGFVGTQAQLITARLATDQELVSAHAYQWYALLGL